jgi:hypothetical protein
MRIAPALTLLAALAHGCGWGEADRTENTRGRGVRSEKPVGPAPGASAKPSTSGPLFPKAPKLGGSNPVAAAQEAQPNAAEPEAEKKRDLSAELLSAVGTPTACLHARTGADAPSSIRVDVEAYLIETGMVTRAYARSSALDPEEIECVRKRVASLRLRAPIEEAPRSVSATLEFKLKTAAKTGG